MKNYLATILVLVAASCGFSNQAYATPLVATGPTYSVYIEGDQSGLGATTVGIFDGLPTAFTRGNQQLLLSENETELGGGRSRIIFNVSADSEIFMTAGETGIIGLGVDGNGINFVDDVLLEQAIIRFFVGTDILAETDNLTPLLGSSFLSPWDGTLPGGGNAFFVDLIGGAGVTGFEFEFVVAGPVVPGPVGVPEPGSLLLGAIGLFALAGARRRRQHAL